MEILDRSLSKNLLPRHHKVLMNKLLNLGVRRPLVGSVALSALDVKLLSSILLFRIGNYVTLVFHMQGTKLGPILFVIMINDLAIESPLIADHWFVDDATLSEMVKI